jgi:putative ABC transport system permease protein
MKYLTYILRNARRNPVRSLLTIAQTAICLFLTMILLSFFAVYDQANASTRISNRIASLNSNGFAGMIPISRVAEISELKADGVVAVSPFSWIGAKYQDAIMPFAQFAVDANTVFTILDEYTIPRDQLEAFQNDKEGCVIGRKLAEEKGLELGKKLPLKGDAYPIDLDLTISGIYDGPYNRDLRMCLVRFDSFDEKLKRSIRQFSSSAGTPGSGNAGMIFVKCKSADAMAPLCKKIDDMYRNTEYPMRTQTEEAFGKMFEEMMGDFKGIIFIIGVAVLSSLLVVAGNSMALSIRERTSEVAVLKAIGFNRRRILFIVLTEAVLVAGLGGLIGSLGCKAFFELFDISKYTMGFLPFFYIPWDIALIGLAVSLGIGAISGLYPAVRAANLSVVDGLRRVI